MIDYNKEQEKILEKIKSRSKFEKNKGSWNKFNGNLTLRVIKYFLNRHFKGRVKGPNVFISNYPAEIDLILTKENTKCDLFTGEYPAKETLIIFEVKARGYFSQKDPEKIKEKFDNLNKEFPHIKCVYLSVSEVCNPKRKTSINYGKQIKKALKHKYPVFILQDSRTKEIYYGEWGKLIDYIKRVIGKSYEEGRGIN